VQTANYYKWQNQTYLHSLGQTRTNYLYGSDFTSVRNRTRQKAD